MENAWWSIISALLFIVVTSLAFLVQMAREKQRLFACFLAWLLRPPVMLPFWARHWRLTAHGFYHELERLSRRLRFISICQAVTIYAPLHPPWVVFQMHALTLFWILWDYEDDRRIAYVLILWV